MAPNINLKPLLIDKFSENLPCWLNTDVSLHFANTSLSSHSSFQFATMCYHKQQWEGLVKGSVVSEIYFLQNLITNARFL